MELFEGERSRKVPSYCPQVIMSGLLELIGKIIAHSLAQGGPGFACLALPCFYYLVTGDIMCAVAYCDCWDIPDIASRGIVCKVCAKICFVFFFHVNHNFSLFVLARFSQGR